MIPRTQPKNGKEVQCTECQTTVTVEEHITHDVKCNDCHREENVVRLKEAAAYDNDDTFSRKDAMERLNWEYQEIPCQLPDGTQLVKVSQKSYTIIVDADSVDAVANHCEECGYDRVRYSRYDNGVISGTTIRCDCCESSRHSHGY